MSTKGTIILTPENEHWYTECVEQDNGENRVYIEIDPSNIKHFEYEPGAAGLIVGIRGDSKLAKLIQTMQDREKMFTSNMITIARLEEPEQDVQRAIDWALNQNFNSVAARHARTVAKYVVDKLGGKNGR